MKSKGLKIEWIDSHSWGATWYHRKDINPNEFPVPITITRGEVIWETPYMLYVAQSVDDELCHNIIEIPKGCILKQKKIP